MKFKIFLSIIATLYMFCGVAQKKATIRGFVYEQATGEPVIFTNVFLKGTNYGAATDVNGYYQISGIAPGNYILMVTYLGSDTLREDITIGQGELITKKLYLTKSSVQLDAFNVSAEKQESMTEVKMSVTKLTPKDIKKIPTVGGEPDLAQYLQVLPGVIFTGDQGGQLYIRGGSPIQNKLMIDGMTIYNPFHSIGLFSVFETDIIRNADIYTGGFGAEYGGRISSIMDITTKDGNKKRLSGKIGASPFAAKVLLEGPIVKSKDGGTSLSFIATGKYSYLAETSKAMYPYQFDSSGTLVNNPNGLPFGFADFYSKLSVNTENGSKVNFFGFSFNDFVKWKGNSDLNWDTWGVGTNFLVVPGATPVLMEGRISYTQYNISLIEGGVNPQDRESFIDGLEVAFNMSYFIDKHELKIGLIDFQAYTTDFNFHNSVGRLIQQQNNNSDFGAYLQFKWNPHKAVVIEPSIRLQYYGAPNEFSPEPRIGAKVNISKNVRAKLAAGMYSQNLVSAVSDRDVVNLFSGFLSGPDNLQDEITHQDGTVQKVTSKLQRANHLMGGVEVDVGKRLTFNLEGYYKRFTQLANLNRNKLYEDNDQNARIDDVLKKDFIIETGDAYGMDFVAKYDYKRIFIWAVYSLGYVWRWDGIQEYHPVFDRRHNINLMGTLTFGKDLNWELGIRWNFGTGFPFSQTQGFYEKYTFEDGIDTDYTTANGELGVQYAGLNQGRLPTYHRLDINLKRKFVVTENSIIEANLGVTNVYNRQNIFYFDRVNFVRVDQLPILPNFGLSWTF